MSQVRPLADSDSEDDAECLKLESKESDNEVECKDCNHVFFNTATK